MYTTFNLMLPDDVHRVLPRETIDMKRFIAVKRIGLSILVTIIMGAGLSAQADMSPGQKILKRTAEHAVSLPAMSIKSELVLKIDSGGQTNNMTVGYEIHFQRPSTMSVHIQDPGIDFRMYSDGKSTTQYIEQFNQYKVDKTPMESFQLLGSMANPQLRTPLDILAEYTTKEPFAKFLSEEIDVKLIGEETINKIDCEQIQFESNSEIFDMWVSKGEEPLVQRVRSSAPKLLEIIKQQEQTDEIDILLQLDCSQWSFEKPNTQELVFTHAKDTELVEEFYQPSPTHQLRGKPAPEVSLISMTGEEFVLSKKKGKEVVILDFWATWCGPCRTGMPIISKVSKEFKDRGVSLYTVNASESLDVIEKFLESTKLDVTVLLDTERKAATAYSASSIPTTVIIGKDGVVRKVHVGLDPSTYEAELRAELTELTQ